MKKPGEPLTFLPSIRSNPARWALFLFGVALILIPSLIVLRTIRDGDTQKRGQQEKEAAEKNEAMLYRLKQPGPVKSLVEDRLQLFSDDLASCAVSLLPSPDLSHLWKAAQDSLPGLRESGLPPLFMSVVHQEFPENPATASLSMRILRKSTNDAASLSREILGKGLEYLVLSSMVPENIEAGYDGIKASLSQILSSDQNVSGLRKFRGRCLTVTFEGRPGWLFWQFLKPPEMHQEIARVFPGNRGFPPESSFYDVSTRARFYLGGILLIVPQDNGEEKAGVVTGLVDDRETVLAYIPRDGKSPKMSPGFAGAFGPQFFSMRGPPPKDWLFAGGETFLDRPYGPEINTPSMIFSGKTPSVTAPSMAHFGYWPSVAGTPPRGDKILVATRLPDSSSLAMRSALARVGVGILALGALLLWGFAVFRETGIAESLFHQLGWGFIMVALLPSVAIFTISQRLADEHLESLNNETRLELRRVMEEKQRRFIVNRPREWQEIQSTFRNSPLEKDLKAAFEAYISGKDWASDPAVLRLDSAMGKIYTDLADGPSRISLNFLIGAGVKGFFREMNRGGNPGSGFAGPIFACMLEDVLKALSPVLRNQPEFAGDYKTGAKQEILSDTGKQLVLSFLGPDNFFDFLFGQNQPLLVRIGIGFSTIMQIFLPDSRLPEFVLFLFYPMRSPDGENISKALARQTGNFQIFTVEKERVGSHIFPESGETIPFIRQAARQAKQMNTALSLTFQWKGETHLVEVNPNYSYHQYIVIGVTSQKPLVEKVERLKLEQEAIMFFALLLTMALAFSGAREILQPVTLLVEGMREVRKGSFSQAISGTRSDELGELINAYNRMIKGLAEGKLLGMMVSSQARAAVGLESVQKPETQGDRREAIVLYFGCPEIELSQLEISPEELIMKLDAQTRVICRLVLEAGGDIDKLMGEKILAVFFPGAAEDHSKVSQTTKILQMLQKIRQAEKNGDLPFSAAIGINTGEVITGFLGSSKRRDHTTIGDAVNLAARCEAIAETLPQNRIVVTDSFFSLISGVASANRLEVTQVKGKHQKVVLYQLLG